MTSNNNIKNTANVVGAATTTRTIAASSPANNGKSGYVFIFYSFLLFTGQIFSSGNLFSIKKKFK